MVEFNIKVLDQPKRIHRNTTGTGKFPQMLHLYHTLAATTAEIISCSSWNSLIQYHDF